MRVVLSTDLEKKSSEKNKKIAERKKKKICKAILPVLTASP